MKRKGYVVLSVLTAVLMILLLVMAIGAQAPDQADENIIKVPDDYPTIQDAIDAAEEGDTIWVALGFYDGNLFIDKGLTLMGGWNDDFTARDVPADPSVIQGSGLGRGFSITTVASDTVVTIDGFKIKDGNATGLGGAPEPTSPTAYLHDDPEDYPIRDNFTPDEHMAQLEAGLASVVDGGLYPGGTAAYQETLARAQGYFDQLQSASPHPLTAAERSDETWDCGGAIYSWNASLHLLNSVIEGNVASLTSSGLGGGVCVHGSAPGGTRIAGNRFLSNIASAASDTPGVGMISGHGGGLYLAQTPGAVIEDNTFEGNIASNGSGEVTVGSGGGIYVYESDDVVINHNQFVRNTASHGWHPFAGDGGGVFLHWADGAVVTGNRFGENLAALHSMCAGGGLLTLLSDDLLIEDNFFDRNWACLVGTDAADDRGGGIMVVSFERVTIKNNTLAGNVTALSGPNIGTSAGGGLNIEDGQNALISGNVFRDNVACQTGIGSGGGMMLWGVVDGLVTDNTFQYNVGSLAGGYGAGGGLQVREGQNCTISNNRFYANWGVAHGDSMGGGGLNISGDQYYEPSVNTAVEGNSFFTNKDAADPDSLALGGGACFARSDGFTFTNNVVVDNTGATGSALFLGQTRYTEVTNNTLVGNSGASAVFVSPLNDPDIAFTNNIIVSHTVGISVTESPTTTVTVGYTLWDGNGTNIGGGGVYTETHPVSGDPAFVDAANHDFHLSIGSPAINAGDPAGVPPAPDHDADGVARPQGSAVDIGAYEWQGYWQHMPLVMNQWEPVVGWAVGNSADGYCTILHTTDGGVTWNRQGRAGELPDTECGSVSAIDADNAWVTAGDTILRTRDGGLTWKEQALPDGLPPEFEFDSIKALDGDTAWAVGTLDILLETTDGQTWSIMPRAADLQLDTPVHYSDVDAADATHVWAVGSRGLDPDNPLNDRGEAVISFYDGVQWQRQGAGAIPIEGGNTLIGLSVFDENNVWAVGGLALPLVKTTDGGVTWKQVGTEGLIPGDTNKVVAVTADSGWITGDYGTIKRTDDGGQSWSQQSGAPGSWTYGVTAMDMQTAWIVGPDQYQADGYLLRTTDGQNWETQQPPVKAGLWGISFVGARR